MIALAAPLQPIGSVARERVQTLESAQANRLVTALEQPGKETSRKQNLIWSP